MALFSRMSSRSQRMTFSAPLYRQASSVMRPMQPLPMMSTLSPFRTSAVSAANIAVAKGSTMAPASMLMESGILKQRSA